MTFEELVSIIHFNRRLGDRRLANIIMKEFILAKIDNEIYRLSQRSRKPNDCIGSSITRLTKLKGRMIAMKTGDIGKIKRGHLF